MSAIEREQVEAMASGLGESFGQILEDFEKKAQLALSEGEASQTFFHQMKGAGGSLGLKELSDFAGQIEMDLKQGGEVPKGWQTQFQNKLERGGEEVREVLAQMTD